MRSGRSRLFQGPVSDNPTLRPLANYEVFGHVYESGIFRQIDAGCPIPGRRGIRKQGCRWQRYRRQCGTSSSLDIIWTLAGPRLHGSNPHRSCQTAKARRASARYPRSPNALSSPLPPNGDRCLRGRVQSRVPSRDPEIPLIRHPAAGSGPGGIRYGSAYSRGQWTLSH